MRWLTCRPSNGTLRLVRPALPAAASNPNHSKAAAGLTPSSVRTIQCEVRAMQNINPDATPASPAVTKKSCHFCGFERTGGNILSAPTRAARVRKGRGARTIQRAEPCYRIMTGDCCPEGAEGYFGGAIDEAADGEKQMIAAIEKALKG